MNSICKVQFPSKSKNLRIVSMIHDLCTYDGISGTNNITIYTKGRKSVLLVSLQPVASFLIPTKYKRPPQRPCRYQGTSELGIKNDLLSSCCIISTFFFPLYFVFQTACNARDIFRSDKTASVD